MRVVLVLFLSKLLLSLPKLSSPACVPLTLLSLLLPLCAAVALVFTAAINAPLLVVVPPLCDVVVVVFGAAAILFLPLSLYLLVNMELWGDLLIDVYASPVPFLLRFSPSSIHSSRLRGTLKFAIVTDNHIRHFYRQFEYYHGIGRTYSQEKIDDELKWITYVGD
ncbi:uncharacterized protein LOC104884873 [Beta vulgaris subsp. vulgaris]|uniref:uncharacterized protein LOC104884873 n=1 Tax=Beta vulgaris subsp. vulgaris TaxID=3555 RepID=UPI00203675F3|nr:uncharacterized protein LOC104884873 [Beta vulgaris subsp. vulgaris]